MRPRILHVFDHSLPLHSGYAFRSRAIIEEQRRLGWNTVHLTSAKHTAKGPMHEHVDGLEFHRTRGGRLRRVPGLRQWDVVATLVPRIVELARRHGSDLIHAHSPSLNGMAALKAGRMLGLPVVYEVRAFWEDAAVDHGTARADGPRYRLIRALETRVMRQAAQVTCICEGLRRDIVDRGLAAGKVTVIPNAVDPAGFPLLGNRNPMLERRLRLTSASVLGFIGSFYAYEGLDLLLEAMPSILAEDRQVRLLLVGGGPQEAALEQQAARLGLGDHVIFTGRVPHDDVPAYSSLIDIFVFPRRSMRLTELVTPLKPLEAMAQGRLVLASDVGGHRELIEDRRTGRLFRHDDVTDLARAITAALGEASHESIVSAGRSFVETERNWRKSVLRYQRVYEQALGSHSG